MYLYIYIYIYYVYIIILYIEQGNVVNQAAELGHNLAGSHDRKKILVSSQ